MYESLKRSSRLSLRAETQHNSYQKNASQVAYLLPKPTPDSSLMSSARRCQNHSSTKASEVITTLAHTSSTTQLNAQQLPLSPKLPLLTLMNMLNMTIQKWPASYIKSLIMELRVQQLAWRQIPRIVPWSAMMTIVGKFAKLTNTTMIGLSEAQTPRWTALTHRRPLAVR